MMKHKYLFLFFIVNNAFFAQKILENDSLKKYSFLDLKVKFDEYYHRDKTRESKLIAKYFLQKAKTERNQSQIAEGYMLMQFDAGFTDALKYIDSVGIYSKSLDKKIYPAKIYLLRGNLYFKFDYLKQALDSYILALKYAKENKNERQIAFTELNIAFLQNYIGKYKEAAKTFRHYLYNGKSLYSIERSQIQQNLVDAYIVLNELDSAKALIQEGIQFSLKSKDKYNYYKYLSQQGYYNVKTKNYTKAVSDLQLCKKYFSTDSSDLNTNYTLFVLGKAYVGLHEKDKAVQNFIKIDSNIQKSNNTFPELREVYTYLIDYYKEKNDKEKQLYYIDRFLKVDKKLDEQFQYLSTELPKKYDTPTLLQEKEDIINDLKNRKTILYASIGILLLILFLILYLYYKAKKTAKEQRKIAQELIHSIEKRNSESTTDIKKEIPELSQTPEHAETENIITKTVPEEVTLFILNELETFENKQLFLKNGITLASLAKNIKTNTSYLSETINNHKGKNFTSYLNDLRIDYVLERLVTDKKFRSYKLPAIAEEIGYNNVQAFAAAFKKKTGTTPSIYIKEIETQQ
ncbi:helix-turn-helix transcriptional regulator [Chryseobacterium sp. 7]|uniref:helix-turn-helix transcriptional regulator n=1 Tax=Chryseobacterium sp. 7 TaxID=2035214 RepID=UPI0016047D57|nr:helix-turn-helix transcriptional regulator [Chryseobacterium sp. 7]